jgi:hypothetical protein
MPMTNAQWVNVDFGSILAILFRYPGEAVLHPRDAVAIVELLRTLPTIHAVVSNRVLP